MLLLSPVAVQVLLGTARTRVWRSRVIGFLFPTSNDELQPIA